MKKYLLFIFLSTLFSLEENKVDKTEEKIEEYINEIDLLLAQYDIPPKLKKKLKINRALLKK